MSPVYNKGHFWMEGILTGWTSEESRNNKKQAVPQKPRQLMDFQSLYIKMRLLSVKPINRKQQHKTKISTAVESYH